jgi:hypothetical protein
LFETETEEYKVLSTWITDFDNDGTLDLVMHLFYTKAPLQQRFNEVGGIDLIGAQRIALFRGFRSGAAAQGSFVFPEPVDETATSKTTDNITRDGTTGAQASALDVDGDGDLDLLWFNGITPIYRENIGSSLVPNFGNVQTYNTTAFDSITLDFDQNIIADVADVNNDGRADIVFTTVDNNNFKLYVSYDQASTGSPTFITSQMLSQFTVEHGHNYGTVSCTDDGYVNTNCNDGGNSGGRCHMGGASTFLFLLICYNRFNHTSNRFD